MLTNIIILAPTVVIDNAIGSCVPQYIIVWGAWIRLSSSPQNSNFESEVPEGHESLIASPSPLSFFQIVFRSNPIRITYNVFQNNYKLQNKFQIYFMQQFLHFPLEFWFMIKRKTYSIKEWEQIHECCCPEFQPDRRCTLCEAGSPHLLPTRFCSTWKRKSICSH